MVAMVAMVAIISATPGSVRTGRRFVASVLRLWSVPDDDGIAALLTSELLTNAVEHAATPMTLGIQRADDGRLRICVRDGDDRHPALQQQPTGDADRGRGLPLIDALAAGRGVDGGEHGKGVCVELCPQPAA